MTSNDDRFYAFTCENHWSDWKILLKSLIIDQYQKVWVFWKAGNLLFPTVLRPVRFKVVFLLKKRTFEKINFYFFPIPSSNFRNPPNLIWNIDDTFYISSSISSKTDELALDHFSATYFNYKACIPYKKDVFKNPRNENPYDGLPQS